MSGLYFDEYGFAANGWLWFLAWFFVTCAPLWYVLNRKGKLAQAGGRHSVDFVVRLSACMSVLVVTGAALAVVYHAYTPSVSSWGFELKQDGTHGSSVSSIEDVKKGSGRYELKLEGAVRSVLVDFTDGVTRKNKQQRCLDVLREEGFEVDGKKAPEADVLYVCREIIQSMPDKAVVR